MKKLIAMCLSMCMLLVCFVSCNKNDPPSESTTTQTEDTREKTYFDENGILKSCVGQADANGVYTVPENITMIGEGAFAGDTALREVIIGENVKIIGSGAFQGCTALETVTLSEGLETIGSYAFTGCTSLRNITLPSTLKALDEYVFRSCTSLESIDLSHIISIGDSAFLYCNTLESVTLSEELETIAPWAFAQCTSLENIDLGSLTKLKEISDYTFTGCSMLRSVTIPEGVTRVGILAFHECTRLASISIPSTVESVDHAAFNYTPWYQESGEDYLIVGDGVLIKCAVHPTRIDLSDKGIKAIGGTVFWNAEISGESAEYGYKYASSLETIVIPEGVREIGTSAFSGCYALKNVTLPSTLTHIKDNAFNVYVEGIETLGAIDLSSCDGLIQIGNYAFYGCTGIETIDLPDTVTEVGEYAFAVTKAYDKFLETASKAEEEKDRYLISGDGILLAAFVADGQTALHIPEGVKMIAGSVFCGWDSAYVPSNTEGLSLSGVSKYNLTYSIKEVYLPEGLESIGNMAFFRMISLEKLDFPDSLRVIGMDAFGFCEALTSISGGNNVEEIQDYAFRYCASIPHFNFSSNTKTIGSNIFEGCASLQTVRFPKGVADIGSDIFSDACASLTQITISPEARPRIYSVLGTITQSVDVVYYED
ncbi:MAG: leucine-rich repeat domain-containing protein [Clostridia bacterium]|nr:leucine-rich repeat domain-containing protein [Clostridia bacterium]